MITTINGKSYLLQSESNETQVLDLQKFKADEVLLALLDHSEYLEQKLELPEGAELFQIFSKALDIYLKILKNKNFNVEI